MEPLKPRDKVTQHMTRDGLTLDNQTTGESVNVSSREAEQEYTAQPEGAAEKILERAVNCTTATRQRKWPRTPGKLWRRPPVLFPGCSLPPRNGPPRSWPRISKRQKNGRISWKRPKKLCQKKHVVTKETVYDEAKGKAKSRLYFDKVEKAPPQLKPNPASRPIQEAGLYLHGKSMR